VRGAVGSYGGHTKPASDPSQTPASPHVWLVPLQHATYVQLRPGVEHGVPSLFPPRGLGHPGDTVLHAQWLPASGGGGGETRPHPNTHSQRPSGYSQTLNPPHAPRCAASAYVAGHAGSLVPE
jgi:hypothetical protein